jgi:hypothetical protein
LLKIGRDEKTSEAGRISALSACSGFFQPKMAPLPPPPRYIATPVELGKVADARSAASASMFLVNKLAAGELDFEAYEHLMKGLDQFSRLYAASELQDEVEKACGLHGA